MPELANKRGDDILARLPYHWAAMCLKHAKYFMAHRFVLWQEKTMALLEEGLSAVGVTG